METLETCLGHIKETCTHCKTDDKNKECPNYKPVAIHTLEVKEYLEQIPL